LVRAADPERALLLRHSRRLRDHLRTQGHETPPFITPIVPVVLGSEQRALDAAARLLARDIFVPAIRPPTVPTGTARLRIVPTAAHTDQQLDTLLLALTEACP
jgi:7-keto-8-aminopelargonate synthetase-like enzyme